MNEKNIYTYLVKKLIDGLLLTLYLQQASVKEPIE